MRSARSASGLARVLAALALLGAGVCSVGAQQVPPIQRLSRTQADRRLTHLVDDALIGRYPYDFVPLTFTADRVHLSIVLSQHGVAGLLVAAPRSFGEERTAALAQALAPCIGLTVTRRGVCTDDGACIASVMGQIPTPHSGSVTRTRIDWPAVLAELRVSGFRRVEVRLRGDCASDLSPGTVGVRWRRASIFHNAILGAVLGTDAHVAASVLACDYAPRLAGLKWLLCVAIVLLPLVGTAWAGRWAVTHPNHGQREGVFVAVRSSLVLVSSVGWLMAAALLDTIFLLPYGLGTLSGHASVTARMVWIAAPIAFAALATGRTAYRVELAIRSTDFERRGALWRAYGFGILVPALIILAIVAGAVLPAPVRHFLFGATGGHNLMTTPFGFAFFVLTNRYLMAALQGRAGNRRTVTTGALVDRVQAVAGSAGVAIRKVIVLEGKDVKVANAWALTGRRVLFSGPLLANLDCPELDAIIAHEVAHIRFRHPAIGQVLYAACLLSIYLAMRAIEQGAHQSWWWIAALVPFGAAMIAALTAISRRHEARCDAEAVGITGDPRAFMRMLARMSKLNGRKIVRGRLDDVLDSHPATLKRMRAVALEYDIALAEVEAIALAAYADAAPGQPPEAPAPSQAATPAAGFAS